MRTTERRGMLKTVLPPKRRLQVPRKVSSLAPAIAGRASATLFSKRPRSSSRELAGGGGWYGGAPGGAMSRESVLMVIAAQPGSSATCRASGPKAIDLSCGFQSGFSTGTRSRVFLVFAISVSKSSNKASFKAIHSSCRKDNPRQRFQHENRPRSRKIFRFLFAHRNLPANQFFFNRQSKIVNRQFIFEGLLFQSSPFVWLRTNLQSAIPSTRRASE